MTFKPRHKLPITVLLAAKNEAINLPRCLSALDSAMHVIVLDSRSTDATAEIARANGAEVVQFEYRGGYPKKRQWALENLVIETPWVLLLDADEVVPDALWDEIAQTIVEEPVEDAFMITKGFHFLGRPMRHGGFSHSAVLLFKTGKARFEKLIEDGLDGLDMEIHERLIVDGTIGQIEIPLIHEDFKGLEAYITRHNKYSTWEALLRYQYLISGQYGEATITPKWFGNPQERRRAIKALIVRMPFEHWMWFVYHYFIKLGFLEGRAGLIASQIRASYIAQVRAKIYELSLSEKSV
jgi:glycosyltransferase involved in cell wall biosynthesis